MGRMGCVFKEYGQDGVCIRLAVLYHFASILYKNMYHITR